MAIMTQHSTLKARYKSVLLLGALISMLGLSACQTTPMTVPTPIERITSPSSHDTIIVVTAPDTINEGDDTASYTEPYTEPTQDDTPSAQSPDIFYESAPDESAPYESSYPTTPATSDDSPNTAVITVITPPEHEDYVIPPAPIRVQPPAPSPPSLPSHNELLERARQNSQQQSRQPSNNNSNLPAFRTLMQNGTNQLQAGNLTAAENSFTRAQRLAPRSSAVYFYLSQVALKKNQPHKAEAMARRGLNVSEDNTRRRALWRLILRSGQLQNNSRVIREATQALQ